MKSLLPKSSWSILLQSIQGTSYSLFFFIFLTPDAQAVLDVKSNGLSDLWEKNYNNGSLFPTTFDPQADDDQDGWTNQLEAAAGTDPKDPNPPDGLIRPVTAYHPAVMGEENGVPFVETSQVVTVTIEDNIEATGVDIVSNSVASDVEGYQDKLWIMAPIAGSPSPADYSNLMKFDIPLSPAADLEMECDHAASDPATVTLNNAKPEALLRGTGADETSNNISDFKIGEYLDEVDLPIRVKTMKHRTGKVAVIPVRCKPGNRNVPMPNEGVLENWLNQVCAYQVNVWFDVECKPQTDYDYDPDNDGIAPFWTRMIPMSQEAVYQDESNDIRIFMIDGISLREVGPNDEGLNGMSHQTRPFAVVNAGLPGEPARPAQQIIETIAHEIGHVLVGGGHLDDGGGFAPLPETDHSRRLMNDFGTRAAGAKLLVKTEWDRAEDKLEAIERARNQPQG